MSHNLTFKLSSPSADVGGCTLSNSSRKPTAATGTKSVGGRGGGRGGTALGVVPPKTAPPRAPPVAVGTVNAEIKVLYGENVVAVVEGSLNIFGKN